jgi:hypothetical protein
VTATSPVYGWGGATVLTREQQWQLEAYEAQTSNRRLETFCSACPRRGGSGPPAWCCQLTGRGVGRDRASAETDDLPATSEGEADEVSPRVVPNQERDALQMMGTIPAGVGGGGDGKAVSDYVTQQAIERMGRCTAANPYTATCGHSYFRDLLLVAESEARQDRAALHPVLRGRDQGALDFSDGDLEEAKARLRSSYWLGGREQRDIGSGTSDARCIPRCPAT